MAVRIIMPKLGMAMSEGVLAKWSRPDGETVQKDDEVAVVMSKKITYKVTAAEGGILRHVVQEKATTPVGAVLGFVLAPGEAMPAVEDMPPAGEAAVEAAAAAPVVGAVAPPPAAPRPKGGFVPASPAARRVAKEQGIDLGDVPGSGADGMVTEADVRRFLDERAKAAAAPVADVLTTPAARQLAQERGLNLADIPGTGLGGRVMEQDVAGYGQPRPAATPAPPQPAAAARIVPFMGMRQAIAENMVQSLQTMAQVTITTEIDATELVKMRSQLKQDFDLTFTDLLVRAVAKALKAHPLLNATLIGDEIHMLPAIHIGVAVALPDGLIVPVMRDADKRSVQEIAQEAKRLAEGARSGDLSVDEVTGGTFTITNLGSYGIDAFTPIINSPEVAILGVGRIVEKPAIVGDQIVKRSLMTLSLTIDHRIVDGAPGAEFLRTLRGLLEAPYRLLT
ncbi:MAG: 2-oxo acid dehydrogenase subunit E2 [Anaerolineae bacterium]